MSFAQYNSTNLMNSTRNFENENLKKKSTYLMWLFLIVAGIIGFQLLNPIIKPDRHSGSMVEWVFTFSIIIILSAYFLFHKRFVSITFDTVNEKITLTTTTLIGGKKTEDYPYADITFKDGKDAAGFRKIPTQFVEIYNKTYKLIKLEKSSIGHNSFDNILMEFQQFHHKNV
ncbi:MAG TPA: hypothetical protein VFZ33_04910 [Chitinophagaceae bacterium]